MDNDLRDMLGGGFDCDCGRRHEVPIREFVYEEGAIDRVGEIIDRCFEGSISRAMVLGDIRTLRAWCSNNISRYALGLGDVSDGAISRVLDLDQKQPRCDERAFRAMKNSVLMGQAMGREKPDLIVAIGSGTVNDLCKWVSFDLGIPYVILATAASMNGYSAANVAATVDGVKTLIEARPPVAVIAKPSVIEGAPPEMATAGFADTIAKFFSHADWLVNNTLLDEYYCPFCAGLVERFEHLFLANPSDIRDCKPEAIAGLFEALFWAGVGMTLVGTSAPASGGEHLLSHTIDMVDNVRGWGHDLHGRQVGIGSIFSAALYERLLSIDDPRIVDVPNEVDMAWWGGRSIADAVAEQFAAKRSAYEMAARRISDKRVWNELRSRVSPVVKSPAQVKQWLDAVGGASCAADIGRTPDELKAAVLHMHEIRKRFTIVDLAWLLGIMPGAADEIIEQWLA